MHILWKLGCPAALFVCATSALATHAPQPIVITLDGHHYVTYTSPLVLSPITRLIQAPEARMANCRRGNGEMPELAAFRLIHAPGGASVDGISMRIEFNPTRVVLDTPSQDVICDGEASYSETGIGRVFRGDFESD